MSALDIALLAVLAATGFVVTHWITYGRGRVTVEGIEFIGARVPDRNGAAIDIH